MFLCTPAKEEKRRSAPHLETLLGLTYFLEGLPRLCISFTSVGLGSGERLQAWLWVVTSARTYTSCLNVEAVARNPKTDVVSKGVL